MSDLNENVYKVLLLGDSSVGKTCFLMKYTDEAFQETHMATIGLDYRLKSMKLKNGKTVKIQIWDTAGQDRFRAITKNYYKGSHGIILIYDITNPKTFQNITDWVSQVREEASHNVVIYLIGNKIDLSNERNVSTEEGKELAEKLGLPFNEASALDGTNINETFDDMVERIDKVFGNIPQHQNKEKYVNLLRIKKNAVFKRIKKIHYFLSKSFYLCSIVSKLFYKLIYLNAIIILLIFLI